MSRKNPNYTEHLLEKTNLNEMRRIKRDFRKLLAFHWDYYSELARQREEHQEEIKKIILEKATDDFIFNGWQRAVKWKYSNHPLCTIGSRSDPGGRFNIGDINTNLIPKFSALYIAKERDTALLELLGQESEEDELTCYDKALTNKASVAVISIKGQLETVLDIRKANTLVKINNLMKKFKVSPALKKKARALQQPNPGVIQTAKKLQTSLLEPNWRRSAMRFDVPANPQIFGQMIKSTGVCGIVYSSKMNGEDCVVIFPENLTNTDSFIELCDPPPDPNTPKRIDSSNFADCEKLYNEFC